MQFAMYRSYQLKRIQIHRRRPTIKLNSKLHTHESNSALNFKINRDIYSKSYATTSSY